jgi:hypothetical protein
VRAKYARQIRRGILRANGDIAKNPIFMPLTTKLEKYSYEQRIDREHEQWQQEVINSIVSKGGWQ